MNIRYRGASPDTGFRRLAEILYEPKEEERVNRFLLLMDENQYCYHGEEEVVTIEVEDKEDYDYIKSIYMSYKKFDYEAYIAGNHAISSALPKWQEGLLTDYGLYESLNDDVDLYIILVNQGYEEAEIKAFMERVSCGPDAYPNAILGFDMLVSKEV